MMIRRAVSNLDPGCHPDFSAPRAQERTAAPTTTIEHDRETTLPDHITLPSQLNDGLSQQEDQLPAEMSGPTSQRNDLQIRQAPAKQDGLDGSYKVRKKDYKKFFRVGRVFSTVWSEGVSGITDTLSRTTYLAAYGERVHSVLRRFVVVRQHDRFCTCLPVSSYRPNGKIPSLGDYGIISSQKPPRAVEGITKKPVHVHLAKGVGPLWDTLVNYARIYTVEMNVKVKDVGDLDPESKRVLGLNFREALAFAIDDEQTFQEPELSGPARPNGFDLSQPSASGTDSLAPFSYSTIDDHFEAEKDYSTLNDVAQDPAKDFSNTSISLALRPPPFANSDYANQVVISMSEPSEHLDPRFTLVRKPRRFFKIGRVFKTLWSEPAGPTAKDLDDHDFYTKVNYGELVFSKIRRFVVIRERNYSCLCLPLSTYSGQGAAKSDVRAQDHAAAYAVGYAGANPEGRPKLHPLEKLNMQPFPIIVEEPDERIDPMTRINFGQVFTIQHNLKIARIGRIPKSHFALLDQYFVDTTVGQPLEILDDLVEDGATI